VDVIVDRGTPPASSRIVGVAQVGAQIWFCAEWARYRGGRRTCQHASYRL